MPSAAPTNDVPNNAVVRMPTAKVAVSAFAANHSRNRSRGEPCRSRASIASSPCGSTAATSFAPLFTLYGTRLISSVTSGILRPMKRLIEKTVFCGFVTA